MKRVVEIENLKNVSKLEFEIPSAGVWLLTGENGTGKTTLLGALRRLGDRNAFPIHFPSSQASERLDDVSRASLKYMAGEMSVVYRRKGVRWVPTPRRNATVLDDFGFSSVHFIGATAERISPKEEDFDPKNARAVRRDIIDAANEIFDTDRFHRLRTVNVTRGQNPAYVFSHGSGRFLKYSSERSFSMGELCVLKLVKAAQDCEPNSLFLIDELELALHPSAQVKLYYFLRELSEKKNLTVIFSTHSVSLIKTSPRNRIVYLQNSHGRVVVTRNPYPSNILGVLASVEERAADIVCYVEDDLAQAVADPLLSGVVSVKLKERAYAFPRIQVVPIGGYKETLRFLSRQGALQRPGIETFALLDEDVESETLAGWKSAENYSELQKHKELQSRILFLPFTPEVGLVDMAFTRKQDFRKDIRKGFGDSAIQIPKVTKADYDLSGKDKRKFAKAWYKSFRSDLVSSFDLDRDTVRKVLGAVAAKKYLDENLEEALARYGKLFS